MEELLQQLGFNPKEAEFYLHLLNEGPKTAAQIAVEMKEQRTNTYMVLESLAEKGVIEISEAKRVRNYAAKDPSSLLALLKSQQERQKRLAAALQAELPRLKSVHALASDKPGVVHMNGLDGYKSMLNDVIQSDAKEVLIIPSDEILKHPEVYDVLVESLFARKAQGIPSRAIFPASVRETLNMDQFTERDFKLRFIGDQEFPGEIAIYGDNVVFTVYDPSLINTIITNGSIAKTMRILFEQLWSNAKS